MDTNAHNADRPGSAIRPRRLYQVRHHPVNGKSSARSVGHKARLLPRAAAFRVAKRLSAAGLVITCDPMQVNVTPMQAEYLTRRYG